MTAKVTMCPVTFGIEASQDESDDCLGNQAEYRGLFGSDSVDDKRIKDDSGEIERAVFEHGEQMGIQPIDSENHKTKYSLNDETPGENDRERVASAGNVVRGGHRLHTGLGEKRKNSIKPKVWRVAETHGAKDEVV